MRFPKAIPLQSYLSIRKRYSNQWLDKVNREIVCFNCKAQHEKEEST